VAGIPRLLPAEQHRVLPERLVNLDWIEPGERLRCADRPATDRPAQRFPPLAPRRSLNRPVRSEYAEAPVRRRRSAGCKAISSLCRVPGHSGLRHARIDLSQFTEQASDFGLFVSFFSSRDSRRSAAAAPSATVSCYTPRIFSGKRAPESPGREVPGIGFGTMRRRFVRRAPTRATILVQRLRGGDRDRSPPPAWPRPPSP
jgi:hypothetical protein